MLPGSANSCFVCPIAFQERSTPPHRHTAHCLFVCPLAYLTGVRSARSITTLETLRMRLAHPAAFSNRCNQDIEKFAAGRKPVFCSFRNNGVPDNGKQTASLGAQGEKSRRQT